LEEIKINIQFKKGVLTLCVLALLEEGDQYGYGLVKQIQTSIPISEGTVYPLLRRLKKEGFLTTYLVESEKGPSRKYYKISKLGSDYFKELIKEWNLLVTGIGEILNQEEGYNGKK